MRPLLSCLCLVALLGCRATAAPGGVKIVNAAFTPDEVERIKIGFTVPESKPAVVNSCECAPIHANLVTAIGQLDDRLLALESKDAKAEPKFTQPASPKPAARTEPQGTTDGSGGRRGIFQRGRRLFGGRCGRGGCG